MDKAKRTLISLIAGIWIIMIPVTAAGVLVTKNVSFLWGELVGSLASTGLSLHMYHTLDIALDIGERASSYAKRSAFFRSMMVLAVLALSVAFSKYIYPVGVFLGLFGMKISVYVQPIITKFLDWRGRK